MNRSKRAFYIMIVILLLIIADHATKWAAIHFLKETENTYVFLGNLFRLEYAENKGAFLSLGAELPAGIRTLLMIGFNTLVLTGLLCYLFAVKHIALISVGALTLVAGGGIGNLIDRILRDGCVVDFMNMGITIGKFSVRTGIFNIADMAIMAGLFFIISHELLNLRKGDIEEKK
ncbi:MAG: signal peptidase II [Candidatus Hydrogenedentes bacterium]|nr:signal peptidase II [Candidatus Hydrogenedentota bacterium]